MADRPEQQAGEPAAAPGADDQQVGVGRQLDQGPGRVAVLNDRSLHVNPAGRRWQDWAGWFAGNGVPYSAPADAVVYPTYGSAVPLAISGAGVLLGWRTLMGDHLRRGLLLEVGPAITIATQGYFMHWPPALTRDAGFQRLRVWLRETVADQG